MRTLRYSTTGVLALLAASSMAQITAPTPLAWRWLYPTTVAPSGAPVVAGDTMYTAVGGRVFSLEKATGNLKWRYPQLDPIPGSFRAAPVVAGGTVVAVGDNKIVYGINPASGETKWTLNTPGSPIGQPIAVEDKYVVFAQSNNTLVAVDAEKGDTLWTAPVTVPNGILGGLASFGNNVLVFNTLQELTSINVATQKQNWKQRFDRIAAGSSPVVVGDAIFVNSGAVLVSLNAATGTLKWQANTRLQLRYSPAVTPNGILVTSAEGLCRVFNLDRTEITKAPINLGSGPIANPTGAGGFYVVLTANGAVNLIDPAQSKPTWSYVVRPLFDEAAGQPGQPGGRPGAGGPPGGFPGRGGAGGIGGGFGGGGFGQGGGGIAGGGGVPGGGQGGPGGATNNQNTQPPTFVAASGPATISGTTLFVPARDGSILAFDKSLGVDLTPPEVDMLFPNPGDQVSGQPPLFFAFRISDDASGWNESTLKIQVEGQDLDYTIQRDGLIVVRFSTVGKNRSLSDGRKRILVTVSDWMGNKRSQSYALTVDNSLPPVKLPGQDQNNQPGGRAGGGGNGGLGGANGGG
jgi:outer membrane protein assembly factor BamB